MKTKAAIVGLALFGAMMIGSWAADNSAQSMTALRAENFALRAVLRLEQAIATLAAANPNMLAVANNDKKDPVQEKLTHEHQKAKDEGYDKQFHEAIKRDGGERLKQEWQKNCRNRSMHGKPGSADLAELNC